ncbi:hypothetical protein [Jeotgalibaca porci]|uniref:hypothetical protein n=1 Tax=Jeotgalibaca porci TaxID=1868793 RepID=UPI00359FEBE4
MIIEISTHSGTNEKVFVKEYDAQSVADIINGITKNETGNAHHVIVLGNNIYSCIDIKTIKVVEVEEIGGTD